MTLAFAHFAISNRPWYNLCAICYAVLCCMYIVHFAAGDFCGPVFMCAYYARMCTYVHVNAFINSLYTYVTYYSGTKGAIYFIRTLIHSVFGCYILDWVSMCTCVCVCVYYYCKQCWSKTFLGSNTYTYIYNIHFFLCCLVQLVHY